ncbi:hypothetical protein KEJ45_00105 [Candidatus Bathyarchaeota archaeon]|nr:hypothetical protein [Candidatus Bathyarchaeota archaeon]
MRVPAIAIMALLVVNSVFSNSSLTMCITAPAEEKPEDETLEEPVDLLVTPALPEDIPKEPYTNSSVNSLAATFWETYMDEIDDKEGKHPLYVLVFADEEEMNCWRLFDGYCFDWKDWATLQIERGDEALIYRFQIDIRILDFLDCEWFSDNNSRSMYSVWRDLEKKTKSYLGQWYEGPYWSQRVDAIIGITAQATPADPRPIAGLAPSPSYIQAGRIFVLLKWQVYWADDNLVQHEISHLFWADDHSENEIEPCCIMAGHYHYWVHIWEDAGFWVFNYVPCAYTSYSWCSKCEQAILSHRYDYLKNDNAMEQSVSFGGICLQNCHFN